jgi:hypothetical protein
MIGIDLKSVFKSRKHTTTHIETNKKVISKTSSNVVMLKENKREISAERYDLQTMPPQIKHPKFPNNDTSAGNFINSNSISTDKNKIKLNNTKHVYIKLNEENGIFNNYKRNSKSMSKIRNELPKNKSSQSSVTINDMPQANDCLLYTNLNYSNKYFTVTEKSDGKETININNAYYSHNKSNSYMVYNLSLANEINFQIINEVNTESIVNLKKIINIMKEVMSSQKKIYEESKESYTNKLIKLKEENMLLSAKSITLIQENNSLKVKILKLIDNIKNYENESLAFNNQFKVSL